MCRSPFKLSKPVLMSNFCGKHPVGLFPRRAVRTDRNPPEGGVWKQRSFFRCTRLQVKLTKAHPRMLGTQRFASINLSRRLSLPSNSLQFQGNKEIAFSDVLFLQSKTNQCSPPNACALKGLHRSISSKDFPSSNSLHSHHPLLMDTTTLFCVLLAGRIRKQS